MGKKPILIEQTAKKFKLISAIGTTLILFSAIIGILFIRTSSNPSTIYAITSVGLFGLCVMTVGNLLTWWYHR